MATNLKVEENSIEATLERFKQYFASPPAKIPGPNGKGVAGYLVKLKRDIPDVQRIKIHEELKHLEATYSLNAGTYIIPLRGSGNGEGAKVRFMWLPLSSLVKGPFNPRLRPDLLKDAELAESIRVYGVKVPIRARPLADTSPQKYVIVYGTRRCDQSGVVGLMEVPALVSAMTDEEAYETAFLENEQHADLTDYERGYALNQLRILFPDKYGTHEKIAQHFGNISRQRVGQLLLHFEVIEREEKRLAEETANKAAEAKAVEEAKKAETEAAVKSKTTPAPAEPKPTEQRPSEANIDTAVSCDIDTAPTPPQQPGTPAEPEQKPTETNIATAVAMEKKTAPNTPQPPPPKPTTPDLTRINELVTREIRRQLPELWPQLFQIAADTNLRADEVEDVTKALSVPEATAEAGMEAMQKEAAARYKQEEAKQRLILKRLSGGGVPLPFEMVTEVAERTGQVTEGQVKKAVSAVLAVGWRLLKEKKLLDQVFKEVQENR